VRRLTVAASALIEIPYLKLACAVVLIAIAVNLMLPGELDCGASGRQAKGGRTKDLWSSITAILLADAIMGLDNIVALTAIARGNIVCLGIGLMLSIPMLVYGGVLLTKLLKDYRILVTAGGQSSAGWQGASRPATSPSPWSWAATACS